MSQGLRHVPLASGPKQGSAVRRTLDMTLVFNEDDHQKQGHPSIHLFRLNQHLGNQLPDTLRLWIRSTKLAVKLANASRNLNTLEVTACK